MGMKDFYCNLQPKRPGEGEKGFGFFYVENYFGTDCTCFLRIPCSCCVYAKESVLDGAILCTLACYFALGFIAPTTFLLLITL
jgi:hypothetical protein